MDMTERKITKIAREVSALTVQMMKAEGVGTAEFDFIHLVQHNPGITQAEVRERLRIDKGAAARRAALTKQDAAGHLAAVGGRRFSAAARATGGLAARRAADGSAAQRAAAGAATWRGATGAAARSPGAFLPLRTATAACPRERCGRVWRARMWARLK